MVNSTVNPIIRETFAADAEASVNPLQIYSFVAAIIWLSGTAIMLIFLVVSYFRLRRRVRVSIPLRDSVFLCDSIQSPFILGIFRPKIYLPSNMDDRQMDYVLAHEDAHLKRLDYLWKPLGFLILSVYWFHPLCWIGYILLCRDIELACDEKVITKMDADCRKEYSETLLSCSISRSGVSACPLAFGEVAVKERIRGVLNYRRPAFWVIVTAVAVCIATSVCFLTNPKRLVSGTDAEKVDIRLIGMDLYGEKPYIEYELINHQDGPITCGHTFSVYRIGDGKEINGLISIPPGFWNNAYTIESGETLSLYSSLAGYSFSAKSTYRFEKPFYTSDGTQYTAYIEFPVNTNKAVKEIGGNRYCAAAVIFDCGMYSLVMDIENAPQYYISEDHMLSINQSTEEEHWDTIGKLEEITLTEENFDALLISSPMWQTGYSAAFLRNGNHRAWCVENENCYVLFQKSGEVYIAYGGDESHFRWIFAMRPVSYE